MKVVITGATSMIGAALTKSCLQNNCEVLAIIRKDSKKEYRIPDSKLLHIVYSDLDELDEVTSYSNNWDVFYHLHGNVQVDRIGMIRYARRKTSGQHLMR